MEFSIVFSPGKVWGQRQETPPVMATHLRGCSCQRVIKYDKGQNIEYIFSREQIDVTGCGGDGMMLRLVFTIVSYRLDTRQLHNRIY